MSEIAGVASNQTAVETEKAIDFRWRGHPVEDGIGIALSGGGYRALLFHTGALIRLNELGLLARARRIASVSGGSLAAGLLARDWANYGTPGADGVLPALAAELKKAALAVASRSLDVGSFVVGWLPFVSAADALARRYDEHIFHGKTLRDLPKDGPTFVFCATNLATGAMWRFTRAYAGDWLVGRIPDPDFSLATVVAASSAFPPVLSPLDLDVDPDAFRDWDDMDPSVDPTPFRRKVRLTDGGVYDNHGLEPIVKRWSTLFVSDAGAPFARTPEVHTDLVNQPLRVMAIADGQSRALRRRDLVDRFQRGRRAWTGGALPAADRDAGARLGAYWAIDTEPARLAPAGALPISAAEVAAMAAVPTRLADPGDDVAARLIRWGYTIADRSLRINYVGALPNVPPKAPI